MIQTTGITSKMGSKPNVFKIAILGDGAVGKTSLIRAKQEGDFQLHSNITIGVDVQCIPFEFKKIDQNESAFLAVDLGGQKRFQFIHDAYLEGVKLAVLVYDLNRYKTFTNLKQWAQLIYDQNPMIPLVIVGAKSDLVSAKQRKKFVKEFTAMKKDLPNGQNIMNHLFISAKNQDGIDKLFNACENLIKYYYSP